MYVLKCMYYLLCVKHIYIAYGVRHACDRTDLHRLTVRSQGRERHDVREVDGRLAEVLWHHGRIASLQLVGDAPAVSKCDVITCNNVWCYTTPGLPRQDTRACAYSIIRESVWQQLMRRPYGFLNLEIETIGYVSPRQFFTVWDL